MPVVTLIGGPNGSGKSTLYRNLAAEGIDFGDYYNADDIASKMKGSPAEIGLAAQEQVRIARDRALGERRDYCWETVMSHPSHCEHLMYARSVGYEVRLLYVALEDPKLNQSRVAQRVQSGGHDVPADRIVRRYYRSIRNLAQAIIASDHGRIFDNSAKDSPFQQIARIDSQVLSLDLDWFKLPRWFIPALVDLRSR